MHSDIVADHLAGNGPYPVQVAAEAQVRISESLPIADQSLVGQVHLQLPELGVQAAVGHCTQMHPFNVWCDQYCWQVAVACGCQSDIQQGQETSTCLDERLGPCSVSCRSCEVTFSQSLLQCTSSCSLLLRRR